MILVPVILLTMLVVIQYSFAYYARQVLAGAAHDGAAAGARLDSTPGEGAALADQLIDEGGGSLLSSHDTSATSDGSTVTVTAAGEVVSVLPFLGTITVEASGSATIEAFDPQGGGP